MINGAIGNSFKYLENCSLNDKKKITQQQLLGHIKNIELKIANQSELNASIHYCNIDPVLFKS